MKNETREKKETREGKGEGRAVQLVEKGQSARDDVPIVVLGPPSQST